MPCAQEAKGLKDMEDLRAGPVRLGGLLDPHCLRRSGAACPWQAVRAVHV